MNRPTLLAGAAVLSLLGAAATWFLSPSGITLSFNKVPLSKVIPIVEKKTKIKIVTDLDPSTPVTLMVHQATPGVVWDALAGAVDARASVRVILAQDQAALVTYRQALASGQRPEGWESYRVPVPGFQAGGDEPGDPRTQRLAAPSPWPEGTLQRHLQTLAESSDVTWTAPQTWDPAVSFSADSRTTTAAAAQALARRASGTTETLLHLSSGRRGGGPGGPSFGGGEGGFRRSLPSPEVIERRAEQRIASLPADQQAAARQQWQNDRAFFQQMRDLSPEQRREKMEEYFNDPAVQERMEDRAASRDERRSPERRRERYREYVSQRSQQQN
jgi:hypothetical protein